MLFALKFGIYKGSMNDKTSYLFKIFVVMLHERSFSIVSGYASSIETSAVFLL